MSKVKEALQTRLNSATDHAPQMFGEVSGLG